MIRYVLTMVVLLTSVQSMAAQSCKRVPWQEGMVYSLNAYLNHGTHIVLPEPLIPRGDNSGQGLVITGNNELWVVEGAGNHIFVKPTTELKEGSSTTVTGITQSNKSYDFVVTRSASKTNTCVRVEDGAILGAGATNLTNWVHPEVQAYQAESAGWERQYRELARSAESRQKQAVDQALRKYRYHIYTRYNWDSGNGFMGSDLISDVYDDGRFTYIRLRNDNKGLMTIAAHLNGKEEVVEARYDDVSKMYRVVGIYPKFTMAYDESRVEIQREDGQTPGGY